MNTKLLMTASSVFMALIGVALSFLPNEIFETLGQASSGTSTLTLTLQLAGAIYFGFAMTNWMAKGVLIGGIYSRPLSTGNFSHFLIAALGLFKTSFNSNTSSIYIYALTIIYVLFAISFGYVTFTHPLKTQNN